MQCHIQYYAGREYYDKLCMYVCIGKVISHGITEMFALEKNYINKVIIQLHQVLGMIIIHFKQLHVLPTVFTLQCLSGVEQQLHI